MAAGADITRKAIAPGSTEYGQRGALEGAIGAALGGGSAPAPVPDAGSATLPSPTDPLGALLSGAITGPEAPLTNGLSIGPGAGAAPEDELMLSDYAQRLRVIATEAASPMLRQAARLRLARMAKARV